MPRPKKQEERRSELIEAALSAASERGLRQLSLADVASQAGLTRGAILYYYEDLDALLIEAHGAGLRRFCDVRDALVASISDPRLQLREAITAGLPSGPDDALMRLLYEFDVLAGTSELHDELVERMYDRQLATYRDVLIRGVDTGVFRPLLSVESLATNLVALEDAYGLHIVAGNSRITVEVARREMLAVATALGAPTGTAEQTPGAS